MQQPPTGPPPEPAPPEKPGIPRWVIALIVAVIAFTLLAGCAAGGIALLTFKTARADAERKTCFTNQRNIDMASQVFYVDRQEYAADVDALVFDGYLPEKPECPADGEYTLSAGTGEVRCSVHGRY